VPDGYLEDLAFRQAPRKRTIGGFDAEMNLFADVFEAGVAHQGAGKQAGLGEDLESVADAQDQASGSGEALNRLHDGRKAGDGAGAEVIAVGKSAGDQDGIDSLEVVGVMPEKDDGLAGDFGNDVVCVVVAVGAGKNQNPEFHEYRVAVFQAAGMAESSPPGSSEASRGQIVEDFIEADQSTGHGALDELRQPHFGLVHGCFHCRASDS
jgi:hypothetical protein